VIILSGNNKYYVTQLCPVKNVPHLTVSVLSRMMSVYYNGTTVYMYVYESHTFLHHTSHSS